MKITKIFSLEDFKDTFPYAALGARTCYSSRNLNNLLNDPRVVSKKDRAKSLSKLRNYKHSRIKKFIEKFPNETTLKDLFDYTDQLAEAIYSCAVYHCKVKRENARFILPNGRKTTIVVSGTLYWIKDFILKRTDPHAQWEIQTVAKAMKNLLEEQRVI